MWFFQKAQEPPWPASLASRPERNINTYSVTLDTDGGKLGEDVDNPITAKYGTSVTLPTPTKDHYVFKGWLSGELLLPLDKDFPVDGNVTLKASWEPEVYNVTFDADGGSAVDAQQVEYNTKATKPADPTKVGYTFKGWFNGEKEYDFTAPVTGDLSLKAKWEIITYNVMFDRNNGTASVSNVTVEHGKTVAAPTDVERTGYTFLGWYNGEDKYNFNTPVTGDLSLTAKWEIKKYTLRFIVDDELVDTQEVEYNHYATKPSVEAPEGYTLDRTIFTLTADGTTDADGDYVFTVSSNGTELSDKDGVLGYPIIRNQAVVPIKLRVKKQWQNADGTEQTPTQTTATFAVKRTKTYSTVPVASSPILS